MQNKTDLLCSRIFYTSSIISFEMQLRDLVDFQQYEGPIPNTHTSLPHYS
jgi:hypothetical protein